MLGVTFVNYHIYARTHLFIVICTQNEAKNDRSRFGDGVDLDDEWEYSRVLLFIQRPNVYLRARIRQNLRVGLVNLKHGFPSSTRYHAGSHHDLKMQPCLGMHIRHGDLTIDSRGKTKLDRSLAAHVTCAKSLVASLGVQNIYLATDNAEVLSTVYQEFPQFWWFGQQRQLKPFSGQTHDFRSESSAQQELANLLVRIYFKNVS